MGNAARKARKRAGVSFVKAPKRATRPLEIVGLGLTSRAEVLAGIVVRGRL